MPEYKWPDMKERSLLGKRVSRLDGPDKVSGNAKYCSDVKRPGMLYGRFLRSPYAHAKVVKSIKGPGSEIQWALDEVVGVAAVDEQTAEDAIRKIEVKYEKLPHFV